MRYGNQEAKLNPSRDCGSAEVSLISTEAITRLHYTCAGFQNLLRSKVCCTAKTSIRCFGKNIACRHNSWLLVYCSWKHSFACLASKGTQSKHCSTQCKVEQLHSMCISAPGYCLTVPYQYLQVSAMPAQLQTQLKLECVCRQC